MPNIHFFGKATGSNLTVKPGGAIPANAGEVQAENVLGKVAKTSRRCSKDMRFSTIPADKRNACSAP